MNQCLLVAAGEGKGQETFALSLAHCIGSQMAGLSQVFFGQQGGVSVLFKGRRTFQSAVAAPVSHSATLTHAQGV